MLQPRWRKVIRDLLLYKTRTILVVLTIAVGVFAFGAIIAARDNILNELRSSFLAINPVSATLVTEPFDDRLVDAVRRMPEVGAAEGQRKVEARIELAPNDWYDLDLFVIPNDGELTVNMLQSEAGVWPPPRQTMLLERSAAARIDVAIGDVITVEVADGETRQIPVTGLAHDLSHPPAMIAGRAYGYITFDTLRWLGGPQDYHHIYDRMQIVVAEDPTDETHIWQVANKVGDKLERSGREVELIDVPTPQQHPAEVVVPTLLAILAVLGVLALILGGFLIVNTIEAILTQQIKQIGVLKAIGGNNRQIMMLYFGLVVFFGLLALLIAMPLGTFGAWVFTLFMANQLNIDITNFRIPFYVALLATFASLAGPVIAAFPSIRSTVNITVREAISSTGAASSEGDSGPILTFFQRIRGLPRPVLLSLRNTFRRKSRLVRTLGVLALGGAIFISVLTVRASLFQSLNETLDSKLFDVEVRFSRPYRTDYVVQEILRVPGVEHVEGWGFATASPLFPDGSEGEELNIYAPPASSELLDVPLKMGRWLLPEDNRAIVVSSNYLTKQPETQVGDELLLDINGKEEYWRIVGVTKEFVSPVNPAIGYVNLEAFTNVVGNAGSVASLRVVTEQPDSAYQAQVVQAIEQHSRDVNLNVSLVRSQSEEGELLHERFNLLTVILSIMAALIGLVGGLGLMGTMSINVLERTKEIGILRAIGASDKALHQIVVSEGVIIGLLAWLLGSLLAIPISRLMSFQIGVQLLNEPLSYSFAWYSLLLWLVVVLAVAALASYIPARNAAQMTIREVLAYE